MSVAVSDPTADLWRSIVFIQINFPSGAAYGGTGVMVGPNDVLTASHALYMPDQGGAASSVIVTPASWGQAPFGQVTSTSFHYYTDFDPSNTHLLMPGDGNPSTLTGSEHDVALIDLSTPLGNQTGWMQLDPSFTSGNVNVTGFPAVYGWNMVNDLVDATQSSVDNVISYAGIQLNPGNSGGPVWYEGSDGEGHVAGVVSTSSWGASVKGVYNDLVSWMNGNDFMIAGTSTPAQTPSDSTSTADQAPDPVTDAPSASDAGTSGHGTTPQPAPATGAAPNLLDFNGDGNADFLLRNVMTGAVEVHTLNGATVTGSSGTNLAAGTDWSIASSGDFNGDGRGDILWQHTGGTVAIWTLDGASVMNGGAVGNAPAGQHVAGVGDFDGDGKSDVLWRADDGTVSTWQMNDHSVAGGGSLGPVSTDWNVAGVGDFNGDGKSDILWRNDNGAVSMWLMDGTSHASSGVMASAPTDWHVAGIGDFNGDQHSDIVWQQNGGAVSIWLMDGDHTIGGWGTVTANHPGWTLAGVGDFNNDHRADLLWQDATGAQTVELMDALHTVASASLGSVGSDWVVS